MSARKIEIYDTTLRDGTQGEGFNLSLQDKVLIAQKLDELGVDYVEGGFPGSNEKDRAFFVEIGKVKLQHAKVSAFGMTRRRGTRAEDDANMKLLLEANTPVITFVGKSSDYQAQKVMGVSPEENLAMIGDSVRLMKSAGRKVVYDAEHFFDTFRANPEYALQTLAAAEEAGASVLCLCDTNGGSMPEFIAATVAAVKKRTSAMIGIHTHNDSALAIANALAAVQAGSDHAQGTINGVGERCGNMDLIPLIANLRLKYNLDCLADGKSLVHLTDVSRYVYETANMNLVSGQPYVGPSAFAHKGGMHVQAVQKDVSTYEHIDPEAVGNSRRILISELSGVSNIATKAGKKFDLDNDKATLKSVLERVKTLENDGYQFEAAEASFELLVRREIGRYRQFFKLEHYRVSTVKTGEAPAVAEATLKLRVNDQIEHRVAEGDGPVNALDGALRKALTPHFPSIKHVHLTDYKVRVINSKDETAASVRVIIECKRDRGDGTREIFGTIGVNTNVIDASWQALVDAYEYHLIQVEEAKV